MDEQRDEFRDQQKLLHQTRDLLHETAKTLRIAGESVFAAIERLRRAQAETRGRLKELRDHLNVLLKTVGGTAPNLPDTPAV